MSELDDEVTLHITNTAKKIYPLLKEKLNCDGLKCIQNNGLAQEIKHYHLHLLPIYKNTPKLNVDEVYEILTK